jgi:hypothetical protein
MTASARFSAVAAQVATIAPIAAIALVVCAGPTVSGRAPVARYTANAINLGAETGPAATLVEIEVDRWSTNDEQDQLAGPLATNRQSDASAILRHFPRLGSVRALDLAGEPIYFARRRVQPDRSERVFLILSRPLRAFERSMQPNMSAFPFSVVELNVDASGKGTGTLTLAATLAGAPERAITAVPDRLLLPVTLTKVDRRD